MLPVVTPEEMAGVDASAPEPVEVLVARAGAAVARAAVGLLVERTGGVYGRRVAVVAGRGGNGADGRDAAARLRRRGARVVVVDPGDAVPGAELVIDAAFGNGLSRRYDAPHLVAASTAGPGRTGGPGGAGGSPLVLAVDIPSGLSALTGLAVEGSTPVRATATVTMAALKPGLLLGDGPVLAGEVTLAAIGLDGLAAEAASTWLVTDDDVAAGVPRRPRDSHKWRSALQVVAGSPGMAGAPWMVSHAAMRTGAGYVRLGIPGMDPLAAGLPPGELVSTALPGSAADWPEAALHEIERFAAVVVGPGLGAAGRRPDGGTGPGAAVGRFLVGCPDTPAVVDADGLNALGSADAVTKVVARRRAPTILTPHEGEWARLWGGPPGDDRIAAVRAAAAATGAVVLLKGTTTVVGEPGEGSGGGTGQGSGGEGRVLLAAAGSSRLATAGTGDVLSGVIGGLLARGVPAPLAAAYGAHVHGRASWRGRAEGLVASDLPDLVAGWLSDVVG